MAVPASGKNVPFPAGQSEKINPAIMKAKERIRVEEGCHKIMTNKKSNNSSVKERRGPDWGSASKRREKKITRQTIKGTLKLVPLRRYRRGRQKAEKTMTSLARVVFAKLVGFLELVIDSFTGHHLGLPLLFSVDRVIEGLTFVEDINVSLAVFAHGDTGFAQGITGTRSLDLVDHILVLQGKVL